MPGFADEQKRVIAATVAGMRVVDVYVPNGQAVDSDKYRYKLDWCRGRRPRMLRAELAAPSGARGASATSTSRRRTATSTIPALWAGQVLCTDAERAVFRDWLALGLRRQLPPVRAAARRRSAGGTTGMLAFPKNHGLRIDHILLSAAARRALHRRAASTATRARARSRPTTRR